MAYFSVVRARTLDARNRVRDKINKIKPNDIYFSPEVTLENQIDESTFLYAYASETAFYPAAQQIYSNSESGSITILQGFCWERGGTRPLTAEALNNTIDVSSDIKLLRTSLIGEFAILHVGRCGTILAFSDVLALSPLYYGVQGECFILANRLDLANAVVGVASEPNREALAELAVIGYRLSRETANKGIQILLQNEHIVCNRDNYDVNRYKRPLFLENLDLENPFQTTKVEKTMEEIFSSLHIIASQKGSLRIGLTGGKDSRLVLALAIAAGLKDRIETYTKGDAQHFDAIVASQIAQAVGVPHRVVSPALPPLGTEPILPPSHLFQNLALHTSRVEASVGAWDIIASTHLGSGMILQGTAGELLKHAISKNASFDRNSSTIDIIKSYNPFDPLDIVDHDTRRNIESYLSETLSDAFVDGFETAEIADLFYAMFRMPGWLGGLRKGTSYSSSAVSPLNCPSLISLAFSAGAKQRKIFRPHYELIARACPRLLAIPLGGDSWSDELRAYGAQDSLYKPSCTSSVALPKKGSWQHTLNKSALLRTHIVEYIRSNADDDLFNYIDKDKLVDIINKQTLSLHGMISVLGVMVALSRSVGLETPYPFKRGRAKAIYNVSVRDSNKYYEVQLPKSITLLTSVPPIVDLVVTPVVEATFLTSQDSALNPEQEGFVTDITTRMVRGWAFVPNHSCIRPTVEVLYGEEILTRGGALGFSRHLLKSGKGDGRYEFVIALNLKDDADLGQIKVQFADTGTVLPFSRRSTVFNSTFAGYSSSEKFSRPILGLGARMRRRLIKSGRRRWTDFRSVFKIFRRRA